MIIFLIILCIIFIVSFYFLDNFRLSNFESIGQRLVCSYGTVIFLFLGLFLIFLCNFIEYIKYGIYLIYGIALLKNFVITVFGNLLIKLVFLIDKKTKENNRGFRLSFVTVAVDLLILLITYQCFNI